MPRLTKQWFLSVVVVLSLALSGCSVKPAQDTKISAPLYGVLDMQKAFQSHPKYHEYEALARQITTLENEAKLKEMRHEENIPLQGLNEYTKNEYTAQMSVKQREVMARLEEKAAALSSELDKEMRSYLEELDTEYGPKIFNLKLKLSTLQLQKEQAESLENEIKALDAERVQKANSKHQELAGKLDAVMNQEQKAADNELAAYSQDLDKHLSTQQEQKQQQMMTAAINTEPAAAASSDNADVLQQKLKVLEKFIIDDIKDKTAKIAAEKGIEVVWNGVQVNISAEDVTPLVIAEFNK